MKPIKMCINILVVSMLLIGCGRKIYQSQLPDDCYIFDDYDFVSSEVDGDFCQAFEYNGRTYYFYSYCGTLHEDEANETLGRLKRDSEAEDPYTIVSLIYNDSDDYLVHHWEGANLMAPPDEVYRAIDTRNREVEKPDFVEDPKYDKDDLESERMAQYWFGGKE